PSPRSLGRKVNCERESKLTVLQVLGRVARAAIWASLTSSRPKAAARFARHPDGGDAPKPAFKAPDQTSQKSEEAVIRCPSVGRQMCDNSGHRCHAQSECRFSGMTL